MIEFNFMNRTKRGYKVKNKRKRLLEQAKSFRGAPNRLYRVAKQQLVKSETNRYKHSKQRKRLLRRLWIIRLNALLKMNEQNYSQFLKKLRTQKISLNRKMISQLSIYENFLINEYLQNL
jgi:large subunit ribosomal protein L20